MEQWLEVTIRTASGGIDLLCAELTEAGFDSFVIDDSEQFRQFLDGARAYWDYVDEKLAARMRDLSQVRLYLPEETAEAQLAELRALLAELPAAIRPVNSAHDAGARPHPGRGLGQFLETELPPPASG